MSDLYNFTTGLLSKLPYSINSRGEHFKSEIDDLLNEAVQYPLFRSPRSIEFLSYSFADLEEMDQWKVKPMHPDFFFRSVDEDNSIIRLSFYYYFRERIDGAVKFINQTAQKDENNAKDNNAEVVSQLFLTGSSFRVRLCAGNRPTFKYEASINTYSFQLPWSSLVKAGTSDADACRQKYQASYAWFCDAVIETMQEDPKLDLMLRAADHGSQGVYSKVEISAELKSLHKRFYDLVIDEDGVKRVVGQLTRMMHDFARRYPGRFVDDKSLMERWVSRLPSIALFSIGTNGWTEYMPAICGHKDVNDASAPEKPQREWHNLGCLVFGYLAELPLDIRAYLRMIAVRVSSVIASRLADRLYEDAKNHALNSAITQTAARNYAHHIGAHVKMRTTPQEIKKRIKELYTGQFNGI